jgi:hypothetical protein
VKETLYSMAAIVGLIILVVFAIPPVSYYLHQAFTPWANYWWGEPK